VQSPLFIKDGDQYQEYVGNINTVRSAVQDLVGSKGYNQAKKEVARLEGSDIDSSEEDSNDKPMAPMECIYSLSSKALNIISIYMPEQLSDKDIEEIINNAILETSATSIKDMRNVMTIVMAKTKGKADSKKVSLLVKSKLT
jgi:Glu-tRNA(Gln) amidotransferase subunit E-like FAD-binding protein